MKPPFYNDIEISSFPTRESWLEAVLAAEVLQGFETLGTYTEAERARVLGITRR